MGQGGFLPEKARDHAWPKVLAFIFLGLKRATLQTPQIWSDIALRGKAHCIKKI